jgi:ribonuclease HII
MGGPPTTTDRLHHERQLWNAGTYPVAGVDEAGRGPLAGPVLVAAVILPPEWGEAGVPPEFLKLNDSKKLTADARSRFFDLITGHPDLRFAIVPVEPDVIDRINILAATHQGMNEALEGLTPRPLHALIDGNPVPSLRWPQTAIVKGDSLSYSIAAASVLAKVTRDRRMMEADLSYPGYGFAQHKGYPTAEHLAAIARLGPCPIHRRSFAPLRQPEPDLFTR